MWVEEVFTVAEFFHINGVPTHVYDEEHDRLIVYSAHPQLGDNYYLIVTSRYKRRVYDGTPMYVCEYLDSEKEYVSVVDFAKRNQNTIRGMCIVPGDTVIQVHNTSLFKNVVIKHHLEDGKT